MFLYYNNHYYPHNLSFQSLSPQPCIEQLHEKTRKKQNKGYKRDKMEASEAYKDLDNSVHLWSFTHTPQIPQQFLSVWVYGVQGEDKNPHDKASTSSLK